MAKARVRRQWPARLGLGGVLLCAILFGGCNAFESPEARVKKGQAAMAAADYQTAVVQFKSALQRSPDNVDARLGLAESALALGDPLSADKELARAIALKATPDRVEPLRWRTALALGRFDDVASTLATPRAGLSDTERLGFRADALARLGKVDEATAIYRALLARPGAPLQTEIGLSEALSAGGHTQEALAELEKVLAREPENAAALVARGGVLMHSGHVDEANAAFVEARKHADPNRNLPVFVAAATGVAETALALRKGDAARAALADLTASAPRAFSTQFLRARLALAEHRPEAAAESLVGILRAQPDNVAALTLQGAAQAELQQLAQAETSLARALHLQPDSVTVRKILAEVQLREGRVEAARATIGDAGAASTDPELLAVLGRASLAAHDPDGAIHEFSRALTLDPASAAIKLDLASAYVAAGRSAEAVAILDQLPETPRGEYRAEMLRVFALPPEKRADEVVRFVRSRTADPGAHTLAGLYFLSVRNFDAGRAEFEAALKIAPADPVALANLARLEFAAGRLDATEVALHRLLVASPDAIPVRIALAEVAAKRSDAAGAARWLEEARAKSPRDIESRVLLARLYANAGQFEAARAAVHEAMAIDPRRMDVLGSGAYVEERAGGGARAQEFLDRATNATPDSADAWFLKGRAQIAVGELRGARASLEQALALRPDWPAAAAQLAGVMIKTGDIDAAFKIVTRLKGKAGTRLEGEVLGADLEAARGNHAAAAEGYGRALALRPSSMLVLRRYQAQRSGRLPGALDGLKAWLGSHPQDTAVRFAYAEALQSNHVAQEAISQYEQALREAPNSAPGLNNLAWLYYSTKDPRALETARRAYALSPQTPAIADTLGWILVGQGQVSEGLGILKAAAAASGVEPDIRFHYAFALAKAGQTAESKQILDSILSSPANFEGRAAAEGLRKELK